MLIKTPCFPSRSRYHEGAYYNYGPHNDHFYGPDRRY